MVQQSPDTSPTITPGTPTATIKADSDESALALAFAQRHRNNPRGAWSPLASPGERRNNNYEVVALLEDGVTWAQVSFAGAAGRRPGDVDKTPRKKRGSPKKKG